MANRQGEIGQQIKKPRIEGALIAGAMVAQKVFKLDGCLLDVSVSDTIEDIDPFLGVRVIQPQPIFRWRRHLSNNTAGGEEQ